MVREVSAPADSFWEGSCEDEHDCERFLQKQKKRGVSKEAADEDGEYDESDSEVDDDVDDIDDDEDTENDDEDAEAVAEADDEDPPTEDEESDEAEPEDMKMATKTTKKTRTGGKTKADAIREVIERRKSSGDSLRPKDIIDELARKGFEVNASQVSVTLRSMGVPAAPRGRRPGTKMPKTAPVSADGKSRAAMKRGVAESDDGEGALSLSEGLDAAAEFAEVVGGFDRATELLDACRRLRERS